MMLVLGAAPALAADRPLVDGQVQKVDREAKKLTIRHGPLPNLDMPAMTMVFRVDQDALLDKAKAGERIRFTADKVNGAYTVMSLEPAAAAQAKGQDTHAGH
jgi:Cu/Ag efflux protein CusF